MTSMAPPARRKALALLLLLAMPACSKKPADTAGSNRAVMPVANTPLRQPAAPPTPQPPPTGPDGFVPLQSDAVKDAIHRALTTGQTQRWQDGALSGYAVPSLTTDAHGCRAVRYTIDQTPDAAPASINACDAG